MLEPALVAKTVSFVATIISATQMKKPLTKCTPKPGVEFLFSLDEPWDTLCAQILAKISTTLNPRTINLDDYDISFFIPRVLSKPGLGLASLADFNGLLKRANNLGDKNPLINLIIIEKDKAAMETLQDHEQEHDNAIGKKTKKQVNFYLRHLLSM